MTVTIKKELCSADIKAIWQFLENLDYIPYQQFPEYSAIEALKATSFIAKVQNEVIGWAQVIEKKNILAIIEFGPIGQTETVVQELLLFIARYYKRRLFLMLRWMPYCYQEDEYNRMAAAVGNDFMFLKNESLTRWTTQRISLRDEPEAILKTFSENHRRSIKKAGVQNVVCRVVQEPEVESFSDGFTGMYWHRGLRVNSGYIKQSFSRLYTYLRQSSRGFFMGAFHENAILGGIIIIYQGHTAFYYRGFINHQQRGFPINHSVFYNAILKAKTDGMLWFDFGGYAVHTKDEQLININKFKDGFRGELISFPPTQTIRLWWIAYIINRLLSVAKKVKPKD